MNGRRIKAIGLVTAGLMAIAVISGCDASEDADLDNGRQLFIAQCGTCHYLKEAGTSSDIGPDLDSAFAAARASGQDQDTFEGVIESQIENPREVDETDPTYMPGNLVEGDDLRDVSAYVASVAGVPGIEPPTAPGGPGGQIYANNGCGSCHTFAAAESVGNIGPNLDDNLPGQSPAEIEASIVDPAAIIVQGFDDVMPPGYGESIPPEDLELLVEFLADNAGGDAAAASGASGGGSAGGSG